ncbi:superoxide dismutase family protein [Salibacterium halotolerans]|uniref:Superoxide dismutase [Cu-Zn] n=1 Tax=Salibacterium halotolerans TaxID=1884432 RepID=A0A1I5RM10_9BACI|nr:superoxide dismutase family protein [Salibacterium halotolerans]SFP59523.1 superoxide dismutase, Cu-Zn family [Salibacterium halotolerans]
MFKKSAWVMAAAVLTTAAGCAPSEEEQSMPRQEAEEVASENPYAEAAPIAKAEMVNTDDTKIGLVRFFEKENGVMMHSEFEEGVPEGFHGFHIHETGLCEPNAPDGPFTTAGGHFNPGGTVHGSHAGDMPSLFGMKDGSAYLKSTLDRITPEQLMNENLAVILHDGPNNFANIPNRYVQADTGERGPDEQTLRTGDSGSRISCGVIKPANA